MPQVALEPGEQPPNDPNDAHRRSIRARHRSEAIAFADAGVCLRLACAFALVLALALALAACASPPSTTVAAAATMPPLPAAARSADFVLLGELHDNVEQHRLRLVCSNRADFAVGAPNQPCP